MRHALVDSVAQIGGAARRTRPWPADRVLWREWAVVALVLGLALYRFSVTVADPDLWGHIKFGETIWRSGRVAIPDPFSYLTSGRLWVDHEWLSEVLFYLVFKTAGASGLITMKAALGVVVTAVLYRHLSRQGLTALRAGIVIVLVIHFFLMSLVTVRTLIFSYPLLLLVLLLIHGGTSRWSPRMWILPALFGLWVNLHPAFLAGLGVLGIWASIEVLTGHLAVRCACLLLVTCSLATAVNPYGPMLWGFLVKTAFGPRPEISEWQPLVLMTRFGLAYAALVGMALWGVIYSRRPRRTSLMVVLAVTTLLPLIALRHAPLAALAIAVIGGPHIGDACCRWASVRGVPGRSSAWLPAGALAGALFLSTSALPHLSCIRITPEIGGGYPARAVALIRESGVDANLAIDFDWGEYALYHLSPAVKVSVDGRRETAYDEVTYAENLAFKYGEGEWDALLRDRNTDLALVRTGFPTFNLMMLSPGWRLIQRDSLATLFGRAGSAATEALLRLPPPALPPDGAGLCFP